MMSMEELSDIVKGGFAKERQVWLFAAQAIAISHGMYSDSILAMEEYNGNKNWLDEAMTAAQDPIDDAVSFLRAAQQTIKPYGMDSIDYMLEGNVVMLLYIKPHVVSATIIRKVAEKEGLVGKFIPTK